MDLKEITAEDIMVPKDKLITATIDETIASADIIMVRNGISSLLILDHAGKLAGIITDGDIIRVRNSTDVPNKTVNNLMTKNPITISIKASFKAILEKMIKFGIEHLPVVDGDELKGIITETRIFRIIYENLKS